MSKDKLKRRITYNLSLGDRICMRLAAGESLSTICSEPNMPSRQAVHNWLETYPMFWERYRRARAMQAECLAEEIIQIADEIPADGEIDAVDIAHKRLRVDARKAYADLVCRPTSIGGHAPATVNNTYNVIMADAAPNKDIMERLAKLDQQTTEREALEHRQ